MVNITELALPFMTRQALPVNKKTGVTNALRFIAAVMLTLLCGSLAQAAEIDVSVDRNPVSINDSFQLTFTASETPDDDPDFSPLEHDFDIINQQQSSQSSWINGSFNKTVQWTLTVMAKHTGRLLVPVIRFGSDSTRPLTLTVTEADTAHNSNDELFLEVEATPEQPYVQAQVIYTLRFYRRVQITQASLNDPEVDNAVVEKLTEDSNYNTRINGVAYAVTERKYAIFPQQSGQLTIPPLVLTAQVVSDARSRFNGFFSSQVTKTKRITSRPVSLNVLPAPISAKGAWLPAEQVHVEQQWSNDNLQVKVGEPLTRTLTLLAKGSTVGQLPELWSGKDIDQVKSYPDQPTLKEKKSGEGVIAFREEKIAFIPSRPGTYQLPAIDIPWFNTQTQKMETARIPSVTLTAIASTAAVAPPEPTAPPQAALPQPVAPSPQTAPANNLWMWMAIFFGSGWLLTLLFLLYWHLRKTPEKVAPVDRKQILLKDINKALKEACRKNDPQAAKQALLQWGKIQFNANSLGAIAPFCEARLRDEILRLNQYLYAAENSAWDGTRLFQTFAEHNARKQIKQPVEDELEPLYRV